MTSLINRSIYSICTQYCNKKKTYRKSFGCKITRIRGDTKHEHVTSSDLVSTRRQRTPRIITNSNGGIDELRKICVFRVYLTARRGQIVMDNWKQTTTYL